MQFIAATLSRIAVFASIQLLTDFETFYEFWYKELL